jgi:hypothetical protein
MRAFVPEAGPGLYTFALSTPLGTQRQLHLRHHRAENETWGINPRLAAWTNDGLVGAWTPGELAPPPSDGSEGRLPVDRTLLALALALFLSGVLVDRTRLPRAFVSDRLRRLRTRT